MIMLHRVPSRLDVDAILHQTGMQMTATALSELGLFLMASWMPLLYSTHVYT